MFGAGIRSVVVNERLLRRNGGARAQDPLRGQISGSFWIVGHPLFQLLLFVFVFGVVFKQRIGGSHELPRDYTTYMLSGLVPWLSFSSLLATACNSVVGNANLVKQFTFKTELLPVKDVAISMIFWFVGFAILTIYSVVFEHSLPLTYALMPVVALPTSDTCERRRLGSLSVSVFVRDIKDVVAVLVTAGIYVLPIVYLPQWVPKIFQPLIVLNPFSSMIWVYQDLSILVEWNTPSPGYSSLQWRFCSLVSAFKFTRPKGQFGELFL